MTTHTIAKFSTFGASHYRVDRVETGLGYYFLLMAGNREIATATTHEAPALIRRAAQMAADDLIGDMVCEGLIGHVCPDCGLGFEDAASLPVHVADGTCEEAARECKP